jgi:hypothetical protein
MDADPQSPHFSRATYKLNEGGRGLFADKKNNVAIIPLWTESDRLGVLITTPEKSNDALDAALKIQKLWVRFPELKGKDRDQVLKECLAAFMRFDFKGSLHLAQKALE